ncbi:MAG: DNA translocase FtsK, partial [Paludibacter sp.]|nr:DNA translocase FtsK [Paludibacter sp.]
NKTAAQINQAAQSIQNPTGMVGAVLSQFFINKMFGVASILIYVYILCVGLRLFGIKINLWKVFFHSFFWLLWLSVTFGYLLNPIALSGEWFCLPGGNHGSAVNAWLTSYIGSIGMPMVLFGVMLIYLIVFNKATVPFIKKLFTKKPKSDKPTDNQIFTNNEGNDKEETVAVGTEIIPEDWITKPENTDSELIIEPAIKDDSVGFEIEKPHTDTNSGNEENGSIPEKASNEPENDDPYYNIEKLGLYDPKLDITRYTPPTLDLLKSYNNSEHQIDMTEQNANKDKIITTLRNYGIEIVSIKATIGPTITLYEIVPKAGIRINKIRNLESDIMLSLAATGIRIIAPIPGKGTIGIEVPNADPQVVSMQSIIASKKFQESTFDLPVAFGRTITNDVFMVDLCKMPHLLVAGATGQGKSVGLNAVITSLLYKKHPAEMKLVLVDPKKVEFNIYADIEKHFLAKLPDGEDAIITDVTKVVETLNSLCKEMDDRYDLLKKAHTRNIKEYNEKFVNRHLNPEKGHRYLPYIVVIVDEFGDLIMTAGKEVEMPIARIAQLARAVGIHMIIATQRPSVNIITGVIKANFPARVAFRVSSMMDSRTILDASGAQQLVGRGDMLFSQGNDLIRVQCAFVDTPEVENIAHFIGNQQGYPTAFYLPEYTSGEGESLDPNNVDMSKRDPMFEEAARLIVASQQGSTSLIQRKLSLGYNRAGRIMDQLEILGIVGSSEGSKARQVLVMDDYHLEQILKSL